jgi:hypothetical protein
MYFGGYDDVYSPNAAQLCFERTISQRKMSLQRGLKVAVPSVLSSTDLVVVSPQHLMVNNYILDAEYSDSHANNSDDTPVELKLIGDGITDSNTSTNDSDTNTNITDSNTDLPGRIIKNIIII